MDLRLVRYVVVVAEELHFGRAAERVHLTQSGLSQAIQRLERELGFEIFIRSSRSVEPTDAGRVFVEDATALLERADALVARARAVATGAAGEFHIGYSPSIRLTAASLLAGFARMRPGLTIHHRQEYTLPLIAAVADGTLDAAMVISQDLPPRFDSAPLARVPLICLVGDGHPLSDHAQATLAEVAAHEIAVVDAPTLRFWRTFLIELFESHGLTPTFSSDTDPVGGELLDPSAGRAWLVSSELTRRSGHQIAIEPPEHVPFDLIWRGGCDSSALQAFREHLDARTVGDVSAVAASSASRAR